MITETDEAELNEIKEKYKDTEIDMSILDEDPWDNYDFSEEECRHYFEKIGDEYPVKYDVTTDLLWYTKANLFAKDCLRLRSKDIDVFLELAEVKEGAWGMENTWHFDGDGFTGFVSEAQSDLMVEGLWTVFIYPDDEESKHYFVMIRDDDEETKKQIISSIQLGKEE